MRTEWTRREMIRASVGAAAAASAVGVPGDVASTSEETKPRSGPLAANTEPWYKRYLVGIEYGPTGANTLDREIYMSQATGKQIIENLLTARAQYLVVFMKDMRFAYYNSRVAQKCPGLGERDLLAECIAEAGPHSMPVIAYCQVQYDDSSWEAHAEWRMKDPGGNDIGGRLCYRSGYLEFIKNVAAEMMEYDIAGFHFDMLDFGFFGPFGCWCDFCRNAFRDTYQVDMPPGVTWDDTWDKMLRFRYDSDTWFREQLQAFVKASRPDISVDFNYHGSPPFSWPVAQLPVQHAKDGHFVTAEGLPFCFGHYNPSLITLFMKGARPDGLVQSVGSRSIYDYHDFTVRPAAELKWEVLTYLAHGAQCTVVDKANYEGSMDPIAYQRLGEAFGEALQKADTFGHKPLQEVGLYYSARSRDWFGRDDTVKYMRAIWGAHKALVQSHVTVGMVMDESVSLERLREFPVVYLANTAILSSHEVGLLEQYVTEGGRMFVTGLTGLYDKLGQLQSDSSIARLTGTRLVRVQDQHFDNYVRLSRTIAADDTRWLLNGIPGDWPLLTWGPIAVCEPTEAAAFGELMVAHRTSNNIWQERMSPKESVAPAVFVNRIGEGEVVYMPCAVDEAMSSEYRAPEHRDLIHNAIRYLYPEPEVIVEAPHNVEIVVTRDEARNRLLVHLLSFFAPPTSVAAILGEGRRVLPSIMEEEMPYTARVTVNRPFSSVTVQGPGAEARVKGQVVDVSVSKCHEVVSIHR
ncbi:MAG TPA: hypothetical protein PKY01_05545 [Candidatus Hydrogenedentes bacterium]|nr:hypothetical protein [Candidatus Hydrogenedentota bacterium]